MIRGAEKRGKDFDLGFGFVNFEVENEIFVGDGSHGVDRWVFGASVRVGCEGPHVGQDVFDAVGCARRRRFQVVTEMPVGPDEMLFNKVEVSRDTRGAGDAITAHALCACASASLLSLPRRRRDR